MDGPAPQRPGAKVLCVGEGGIRPVAVRTVEAVPFMSLSGDFPSRDEVLSVGEHGGSIP